MEIRKILFAGLLVACFSSAFADKPLVEEILQSGALPTGSATLAALNDRNGESVTQSVLQGADFWNNDIGINWDPSTSGTIGNPWLKTGTALPIQHTGQEGYSPFYDTTITVDSTDDYKNITGLYGYKITINLTNDLNFEGESLPPLFNIVAFIGNNHTISNFYIKSDCQYAGLLATVTDSVCDLTLEINGFENISNTSNAGALVGYLPSNAKIWNCRVVNNTTGVVTVSGTSYVGGLVGYSDGTIDSCSVSRINVQASVDYAGGLVGYAKAKISNCSVDTVTVTAQKTCVGGLVGYTNSGIEGCSVTKPTVSSTPVTSSSCYVGGLVGCIYGESDVKNCTVKNATVSGYTMVGGLIGYNAEFGNPIITGTIQECRVDTVTVTSTMGSGGGLVGYMNKAKNFTNCTVKAPTVTGPIDMGGLIGRIAVGGGNISSCSVENATVQGETSNSGTNMGGLIGFITGNGDITDSKVETVTVKGILNMGGLIGYVETGSGSISSCSVGHATVQGMNTGSGTNMGGLIGLIGGTRTISECKVMDGQVTGKNILGGLIGSNAGTTTISKCCVGNVPVTATSDRVGGLIGYNKGNISNCSVSNAALSTGTYIGGIVGYNEGATVLRCLVTGTTIYSTNTDPNTGEIGGIAGYNGGTVSSCVAMIQFFDIKARYTKSGNHFGRIVGNNGGTLVANYGWVETTIRYWHYRFGINWGTDYYKGTGNTYTVGRNGGNLYVGNVYSSAPEKANNGNNFWTNLGFKNEYGWSTTDVGTNSYPKLTFVQGETLGSIGTARGFEYEAHLIADNGGDYNSTNTPGGVKIFTPQFFSKQGIDVFYANITGVNCDLYTDIELATEDGNGNTVFWSTDLSILGSGNFAYSAIRFLGTSGATFFGHGHSIIGYHKEYKGSQLVDIPYYNGFFYAANCDLTITRLGLENPYVSLDTWENLGSYVRFGFLVSQALSTSVGTIKLEDIYVENPKMYIKSQYPDGNDLISFAPGYNGFAGTMIGKVNNVNGKRLAVNIPLDVPNQMKMECSYTHIGCLFGFVSNSLTLDGVAVSVGNSLSQIKTYTYRWKLVTVTSTIKTWKDVSHNFSIGYVCAMGSGEGENKIIQEPTYANISLHDGHDENVSNIDWKDFFPEGTFGGPLPFVVRLGYNVDAEPYNGVYRDCGADYPKAGSFYNTLVYSGIKGNENWEISESPYYVRLKREEYTGNY